MIDVTFTLNNVDWSGKLSTYQVIVDSEYPITITTLDGTEHVFARRRPSIQFSLIPLTDLEVQTLFNCLKNTTVTVQYTNPYNNRVDTATMRVTTNLIHIFGLRSVTGDRYYKGTEINLRQLTVM